MTMPFADKVSVWMYLILTPMVTWGWLLLWEWTLRLLSEIWDMNDEQEAYCHGSQNLAKNQQDIELGYIFIGSLY